jgi:formylglycine-generating enzyme required for sulfatase activity
VNSSFDLKHLSASPRVRGWGLQALAACALGLSLACSGGGGGGGSTPPAGTPSITSFTAAKSPITAGDSTTLTAVFTNGTGSVDNAVGAVTTGVAKTVTPAADTTYNLTVTNGAATPATASVTVRVVAVPDATVTAPANVTASQAGYTASVPAQAGATFAWTITGATPTTSTSRVVTFTPDASGTVHFSCIVTNEAGTASTPGTADSTIVAAPTITSFTAAASPITVGNATTLTGNFAGGTGVVTPGGLAITSMTPLAVSPATNTTYTLTVTNAASTAVTATATVNVVALPATPVITIPSTPSATTLTTTQSYTASVAAQTGCTYTWSVTGDATVTSGGSATDTSVTFTANTVGNTIDVDCTVTNAAGTGVAATQKHYTIVAPVNHTVTVTITGVTTADVDTTLPGYANLTATTAIDCTSMADGAYIITANDVVEGVTRYPYQRTYNVSVTGGVPSVNALTVLYPAATLVVNIPNTLDPPNPVPMTFMLVPPGSFQMGGAANTYDSNWLDATDQHTVTISHAFYVARNECTQAQWKAVTGSDPSWYTVARGGVAVDDDRRPVDYVSWDHIRNAGTGYLALLNTAVPSHTFRLPSEAEFEYFVRAGTTTNYFFGDSFANLSLYAVWNMTDVVGPLPGDPGGPTSIVGSLAPNPWGLYDVLGNVWEWCEDDAHGTDHRAEPNPPTTDGTGYASAPNNGTAWVDAPRGATRILRGGGLFGDDPLSPRSAFRYNRPPSYREGGSFGFRLVMDIVP